MEARRVIYLLLGLLIAIPYIQPLGIPVALSQTTRDFYNTVDSLPQGSVVVFSIDIGLGTLPELGPAAIAVLQHLLNLPVKLIITGATSSLPVVWQNILTTGNLDFHNRKYGEDWVNIGFYTGGEAGVAALASNMHLTVVDINGTPLEKIPVMKNVKTARDVAVIITVEGGNQTEFIMRQWQGPYGTKVGGVESAVNTALLLTYYVSGKLFGIVNSLRGGAEYELLIRKPGKGVTGTDMLSMSHLFEIGLIIAGNAVFLYDRYVGSRKREAKAVAGGGEK